MEDVSDGWQTMAVTLAAGQQAKTQSETLAAVETPGYAVIVVVAAALRFWNLAAAPLTAREAAQALAAFNGTPLPAGGSPLLYALNQVLFGVFGANVADAGVRLGSAVFGTALVLLPILWRKHIGAFGALAAAAMIAISPSLVLASRTLDGQIVAVTCATAIIGLALRYFDDQRKSDLIGLGIAIGLALTSGPGIITLLIVTVPALLIVYRWIAADDDRTRVKQAAQMWRTVLLWSAVTFVAVATVILLRPAALSSAPDILTAWLKAWNDSASNSSEQLVQILLMYEPLIIVSGFAGFVYGLRRVNGRVTLLAVWFIGALLIVLLQPGRQTLDVTLALVPLALLGGMAVEALINLLRQRGAWKADGLLALAAAPIVSYLAIIASSYAAGSTVIGMAQFLGLQFNALGSYVILVAIAILIFGGMFALLIGVNATLRGAAAVGLVLCALISFGNVWGVTQRRASDPRELLWGPTATAPDVHDLIAAIEAASERYTGFPYQTSVTYSLPQDDPVLRWYLRRFANVTNSVAPNTPSMVIVTPLGVKPTVADTAYIGAKFTLRTTWDQRTLPDEGWMRWWLYRETPQSAPEQETIVVWVKPK